MRETLVENVNGQWVRKEAPAIPDGALGSVMPGEMAACSEHNAIEQWKAERDPSHVPQYRHPAVVNLVEPEIDRDADRSGFNGIVKDVPKLQPPPVQPGYRIEGRPDNVEVTPTLAYWIARAREKEGMPVEPAKEEAEESIVPDTGCTVLPAFPPWGCQQEDKVASGEPALPAEEPAEGLVPDTMPGIWKSLGFKAESLYDFGTRTLSPARKTPSLDASFKAYRKNMLLTVARALLAGAYGRKYSAEQVRKSVIASWKGNGRMKGFSDVLKANRGPALEKRITEILDDIPKFIDGKVETAAKYMKGFKGEQWCIKSFVRYVSVSKQLDLKKSDWRSSKKK